MDGFSNNCILHCALRLNLGSLVMVAVMFDGIVPASVSVPAGGSAQPPPKSHMDHDTGTGRMASVATLSAQKGRLARSEVHPGFAQRMRSATCAQRLMRGVQSEIIIIRAACPCQPRYASEPSIP